MNTMVKAKTAAWMFCLFLVSAPSLAAPGAQDTNLVTQLRATVQSGQTLLKDGTISLSTAGGPFLPFLQSLTEKTAELQRRIHAIPSDRSFSQRLIQREQAKLENLQRLKAGVSQAATPPTITHFKRALFKLAQTLDEIAQSGNSQARNSEHLPFGSRAAITVRPATDMEALYRRLGSSPERAKAAGDPADPALLAETIDAGFQPSLQALAAELNHDPTALFNWVHNTIEFVPSYGSLQGAAYTAELGRGNAFDQASLLLALLRISGIPACYVMGTVEIPVDQAMNWVGGVKTPEALQNLLGQGGIPNRLIAVGNTITHVEMEHIWVEAWGSFPTEAGGVSDQWLPMDASFKTYTFTPNRLKDFTVDGTAAQAWWDAATYNPDEGWISGLDGAALLQQIEVFKNRVSQTLTEDFPNATAGTLLGQKTIVPRTQALRDEPPYELVAATAPLSGLSEALRHRFRVVLQDAQGLTELVALDLSTPEWAGKSLSLAFSAANPAEEEILIDYLNAQSQPGDLTDEIPVGLINMVAQITLDGLETEAATTVPLGEQLQVDMGFWSPGFGWETSQSPIIAGSYQAVGLDLHGVSLTRLQGLKDRMAQTQARFIARDTTLNKDEIAGDFLQMGVLGYLNMTRLQGRVLAKGADVVSYRMPSYGTLSTVLDLTFSFGVPDKVKMNGLALDMDRMHTSSESVTNCWNDWQEFNQVLGSMMSTYEHRVLDRLTKVADQGPQSFSAVKALSLAMAEGQRLYTLSSANAAMLDQVEIDDLGRQEISAQLAQGKQVFVHERPIQFERRQGSGFVVIDPQTGSGAYKIVGGLNGGVATWQDASNLYEEYIGAMIGACLQFKKAGLGTEIGVSWLWQLGTLTFDPIENILLSGIAYGNIAAQAFGQGYDSLGALYCELSVYQFSLGMSFLAVALFPQTVVLIMAPFIALTVEEAYNACSEVPQSKAGGLEDWIKPPEPKNERRFRQGPG